MSADNAYQPPSGFSAFPPVIKNLLILNGLVFLAQLVFQVRAGLPFMAPIHPLNPVNVWFALWSLDASAAGAPSFYPWQFITSGFLHGGFGHIIFNMFGLWMFGAVVERTLGSKRFLSFYLLSILGASLLQFALSSGGSVVGASGGVLGVMAAFGMLFPEQKIFMLFFPVPIPARWFVLGYAAFSLFAGFQGVQGGVAHFAHLGGMITGALLILYWRRQKQLRA